MWGFWPIGGAALGAALLAIFATTPPAPLGRDAPATAFSAERAMVDVRAVARAPHPTGSAEHARVRAYLADRLRGLGMAVRETPAAMSDAGAARLAKWSGDPTRHAVVNIVATLPAGPPGEKAVLLMAHYDSVWDSPGAADDGAGVAAILEIVRALKDTPGRRRPVVVVFTDGEELGLEGAKALFADDPDRAYIGTVVNLEARGGGGRAAMFETGRDNGNMMRLFADHVRRPSATSLSVLIYELLPNSTDFTPAKTRGISGFNFAFIGRPGLYHSPLATPDNLDRGALQDLGAQALDLTRALAVAPALPAKAPNLVFFDAFGAVLIAYPPQLGWAVVGAAALLLALAGWRTRVAARDVMRGAVALILMLVAAAGLLFAFNQLSGAGAGANYYDRLAAIPRLQVQALLLALASGAAALMLRRQDGAPIAEGVGAVLPMLLLAAVLQAAAPTAAFVVAWPVLFAGIAVAALAFMRGAAGQALAAASVAVAGGWLLGFGFFLMQAIGPDTPSAAALPAALLAMLAWPLVPRFRRGRLAGAMLVLAVAAGVIALWVRLDPMAATVATYSLRG